MSNIPPASKPGPTPPNDHPEPGPNVTIVIDNTDYKIHRGHQTVAAIKALAGIPVAYELEQVVDGKPNPLADDGAVTIKGGERFISHPRTASSS